MRLRVRPLADGWGQRLSPVTVAVAIGALLVAQVAALLTVSLSGPDSTAESPMIEDVVAAPPETVPETRLRPDISSATEQADDEAAEVADASAEATSGDDAPSGQAQQTVTAPPSSSSGPVAPDPGGDGEPPPARRTATSTTSTGSPESPARQRFESRFPDQARATQEAGTDPASAHWAVLVGVNAHQGRTRDNVTSRQDAELIRRHLLASGWKDENIVLLVDGDATREMIEQAIAWLARKTTEDSVAVFHFSGHIRSWNHQRGRPDVALWPSDNNFIGADDFARRLGAVDAGRMWVNIQACHAEAMNVPGLRRDGRLLTFSSRAAEKSYEDPERGYTVFGYYLVHQAMVNRVGGQRGDVTVEEAFAYAEPRVPQRTSRASHGPQHPVMVSDHTGGFTLRVPPPPADESDDEEKRECLVGFICRP